MSSEVRLAREMRLLDVTMIGVGAMIGAGIFVLTGIAAGVAGPALVLVFLLNGLVAFLTAAAYAELGSAVHGAGGGYLWIKASLPDPSGFLAGWMDWFAHAVRGTPHYAIFFSTVLIIFMAVALPIEDVAAAASVMFLLLFGGVNIALIRLRKLRPDLDRGYKVPFMPFRPLLACGAMLFIAVFMFVGYPLAWLAAGGWIVAGFGFYHFYSRSREKAHTERVGWMERLERKEYRVLVAISSPETIESLMSMAVAIAGKHAGDIVVASVIEVPEGDSLFSGRRRTKAMEPLLERCVRFADEHGIRATSLVKIGRRTSESIVQTAREESCNLLILGPPRGTTFVERLVSSIGDYVLKTAPCQVAVVYGSIRSQDLTGVVVPVTTGPNSRLAVELTPAISDWIKGPARFMTIVPDDVDESTADRAMELARTTLSASEPPAELLALHGPDAARGLLAEVRLHDLVLVGAPSEGPISPLFGETVPGVLATHSSGPVVIVRNVEPHQSGRFQRFFFG
ncbi:MAG: amino acid permease [Vicinamibacteria bacterium]|nr:amino acid permease [Vicinamibacteria bacterium]